MFSCTVISLTIKCCICKIFTSSFCTDVCIWVFLFWSYWKEFCHVFSTLKNLWEIKWCLIYTIDKRFQRWVIVELIIWSRCYLYSFRASWCMHMLFLFRLSEKKSIFDFKDFDMKQGFFFNKQWILLQCKLVKKEFLMKSSHNHVIFLF